MTSAPQPAKNLPMSGCLLINASFAASISSRRTVHRHGVFHNAAPAPYAYEMIAKPTIRNSPRRRISKLRVEMQSEPASGMRFQEDFERDVAFGNLLVCVGVAVIVILGLVILAAVT